MQRIQLYIDEDLDDILRAESARTGQSKAALIRSCFAERFHGESKPDRDPLSALVGSIEVEPTTEIDEVIYGR